MSSYKAYMEHRSERGILPEREQALFILIFERIRIYKGTTKVKRMTSYSKQGLSRGAKRSEAKKNYAKLR